MGIFFEHAIAVLSLITTLGGAIFSLVAASIAYLLRRNERAKDAETQELKSQVSTIYTDLREILQRITRLESRMPNGELNDIRKTVVSIEAQLANAISETKRATEHIEEHNHEAEEWKRKIDSQGARLDALESIIERRHTRKACCSRT